MFESMLMPKYISIYCFKLWSELKLHQTQGGQSHKPSFTHNVAKWKDRIKKIYTCLAIGICCGPKRLAFLFSYYKNPHREESEGRTGDFGCWSHSECSLHPSLLRRPCISFLPVRPASNHPTAFNACVLPRCLLLEVEGTSQSDSALLRPCPVLGSHDKGGTHTVTWSSDNRAFVPSNGD